MEVTVEQQDIARFIGDGIIKKMNMSGKFKSETCFMVDGKGNIVAKVKIERIGE